MTTSFTNYQQATITERFQAIIDNIKLLLYKSNEDIFDQIDFDDDFIYSEPMLFAFFNSKDKDVNDLNLILFGYRIGEENNLIKITSDRYGRIYLPNIGWLVTESPNTAFSLLGSPKSITLLNGEYKTNFKLDALEYIGDTGIELLKYPIPLLKQFYYDSKNNPVEVEIDEISKKHKRNLEQAYYLIKTHSPEHYKIICSVVQKCVVFNVNSALRNSFATLSAQGISFFNAYQEDYNEVFFVDDIAHQTGHLIFNVLIYEVEKFINVSPDLVLDSVVLADGSLETRNIYIIFHALYTYYAIFTCLNACLAVGAFSGHKKHEAVGRMSFYIRKCYSDLGLIERPKEENYTVDKLFTREGLVIYNEIKNFFIEITKEWGPQVKNLELSNQTYNFNYSIFLASNPLDEQS
ncbi:hypothetical protein [Pedobacter gandavensis]|uniref:hypothetical protein n=1 Tax=Pedobacter gandavensis TaxID=2679963 RepID=UPI002930A9C9|nr:hypothetical protein [Pedobacter gandavensis]